MLRQTLVTEGVRVSVRTQYLAHQSNPMLRNFAFAYEISIFNESEYIIQLISRFWDITDAFGVHRIVEGLGVVGLQPILKPEESHVYVSGSVMTTAIGRMTGSYTMVRITEQGLVPFEVKIPPFILAALPNLN